MSMLGPNEPYPEEGQMADLRTLVADSVRRHPRWDVIDHYRSISHRVDPDTITAVEDHAGESFWVVLDEMICEAQG